jgi:glycosyltransferase involved in cell wall biosynthesis
MIVTANLWNLLRRYLSAADGYVFPSRVDAFGIAIIEAMACGFPVVAAYAPAVLDILADGEESGGLMVPRRRDCIGRSYKAHIGRCKVSFRMAECALRRVENMFSMEAIGNQLRRFLLGFKC